MATAFISYARGSNKANALALHAALERRGIDAFLDTSDIDFGESFPARIADELLRASVCVCLVDDLYFTRPYCQFELELILSPIQRNGKSGADETPAPWIVIGINPTDGAVERLGPAISSTAWPGAHDVEGIAKLTESALANRHGRTLEEEMSANDVDSFDFRERLIAAARLRNLRAVVGLKSTERLPRTLGSSLHGRDFDLWRLDLALAESSQKTSRGRIVALEGGAGFGKSQLAAEYVHRYAADRFPGGVFWLDGDVGSESLATQQYEILTQLTTAVPPLEHFLKQSDGKTIAISLREAAKNLPNDRVLFVIDNFPEPSPGISTAPIESINPLTTFTTTLVTSRLKLSLDQRIQCVELWEIAPEAAIRMLRENLPQDSQTSYSDWRSIVEWVGNQPLALSLLNAMLRSRAISSNDLLHEISSNRSTTQSLDQAAKVLSKSLPVATARGITSVLRLTFEKIGDDIKHAAFAFAYLAPISVSNVLLESFPSVFTADARLGLISRSIVQAANEGSQFGSMHRLIADYCRESNPNRVRTCEVVSQWILDRIRVSLVRPSTRSQHQELHGHALALLRRNMSRGDNKGDMIVLLLGNGLTESYQKIGAAIAGLDLARTLLQHFQSRNLPAETVLSARAVLAQALYTAGHYKTAFDEASDIIKSEFEKPTHDKHLITEMAHLTGLVFLETQQWERAVPTLQNVVSTYTDLFGAEHRYTKAAATNLLLAESKNGADPNESAFRVKLEAVIGTFGESSLEAIRARQNLGIQLGSIGRFPEAILEFQFALKASQSLAPSGSIESSKLKLDLAYSLFRLPDIARAIVVGREAFEELLDRAGNKRIDTIRAAENLAMMYESIGETLTADAVRALAPRVII